MKKYTKRLVAFLLATVMVLTGLPMNAIETKAAEPESFVLDFGNPTDGVVAADGSSTLLSSAAKGTYQFTTDLKGNGWSLNAEETATTIPKAEGSDKHYLFSDSNGALYHKPGSNKSVYQKELEVALLMSLRLGHGNTVAFDFTAPSAGEYEMQIVYVQTGKAPASATVNGTTLEVPAGGVENANGSLNYDSKTDSKKVTLNNGTNTIYVTSSGNSSFTGLRAVYFTKVKELVYGAGTFNLNEGAMFDVNETFDLAVTALATDETDITNEITVEYSSSNGAVATVENGVLTAVGKGEAVIKADVYYKGELKETIERNILVGAFVVDFTEFDTETAGIAPDAYFTTDTVSKKVDAISVPWSVIEANDKSTNYRNFGGYLQVLNTQIKFNFEAPSAGLYDLTANVYHRENQGYAAIYVNDEYVGNYYCFAAKETDKWGTYGDKHLLSVKLAEGDNTITIVPVDAGEASKQQTTIASLIFEPIAEEEAKAITGVSSTINGEKAIVVDLANLEEAPAKVDSIISTTDGDVLVLFESGKISRDLVDHVSSDGNVVYVNRWGELTYIGVGEVTITANVGEFTDTVTIKVVNTAAATVTYVDEDGTVFKTFENVEIGTVTPTIENPTKDADAEYTYTFAGWTPGVAETVTGDATYTATWTKTKKSYTVTWVVDGVETEETYEYGAVPTFKGSADKAADAYYTYSFAGWDVTPVEVTGDVTYTAKFDRVAKTYANAISTRVDSYGELTVDGNVVTLDVTGEVPYLKNPNGVWANWIGFTVTAPEGVDATKVTILRPDGTTTTLDAVKDSESTPVVATLYQGAIPTTTNLVRTYKIDWNGDAEYDLTVVMDLTDATLVNPHTEAISTRVDSYGELTVDGNVVTLDVTGEVPYLKNPNGVWANWIGFTLTAPEGVDATKVTILRPDGTTTTLDAVKDSESTPVVATLYQGAIPTTTNLVRTYKIDWNGDAEYDLTVVMDLTNATLLTKTFNVTWVVNGVETKETYVAGTTLTVPTVKDYADEDYTYAFTGWDKEVVKVVEADATYTAVFEKTAIQYAARVNGKGYFTFDEAYAKAEAGDVLSLCKNLELSTILTIDKAIELDGKGFTLTSTAARAINVSGADGVTIKNLTINASGERAINVIQSATNVTVENVTATAANYAINVASSAANAVVTVNNSDLTGLNTVNVAADGATVTVNDTKITCNDQTDVEDYAAISVNADNSHVAVTGGEVVVNGDSTAANIFGVDSTVTFDGTIGATEAKLIVAKIGEGGFYTLQDAVDYAAEKGGTVTLVRDITLTEKLVVNNKVTLNLSGKTLTLAVGNDGNYDVVVKGDLTIEGEGTVYVESAYGIGVTGTLTVDGGKFIGTDAEGYVIGNWGTTTINGGNFEAPYMPVNGFAGKVTIAAGTFKSADADYVVAGNVTITGGTFDRDVTEYCAEGLAATPNGDGTYGIATAVYTITWVVNGVETEETYEYGSTPTFKGSTEKAADEQYTYTFKCWTPEVVAVTGEATYTATYTETVNKYTVTWMNPYGVEITSESVEYGKLPTVPTATYKEYTFLDWDKEVVAVTEDVTYTAIYDINGIDWTEENGEQVGYYYVDGKIKKNAGVVEIEDAETGKKYLYYVCYSGNVAAGRNQTVAVGYTNGYVEPDTYYFFANGVMETEEVRLNGEIIDGVYYVNGEVRKNVGLVECNGYLYYVMYSGAVKCAEAGKTVNQTITTEKANGLAEEGLYQIFDNGVVETAKVRLSGQVDENGEYRVFGVLRKNVGLVKIGEDYYFVQYSGTVKTGFQTIKDSTCNGYDQFIGVQKFAADGKMIIK